MIYKIGASKNPVNLVNPVQAGGGLEPGKEDIRANADQARSRYAPLTSLGSQGSRIACFHGAR